MLACDGQQAAIFNRDHGVRKKAASRDPDPGPMALTAFPMSARGHTLSRIVMPLEIDVRHDRRGPVWIEFAKDGIAGPRPGSRLRHSVRDATTRQMIHLCAAIPARASRVLHSLVPAHNPRPFPRRAQAPRG